MELFIVITLTLVYMRKIQINNSLIQTLNWMEEMEVPIVPACLTLQIWVSVTNQRRTSQRWLLAQVDNLFHLL